MNIKKIDRLERVDWPKKAKKDDYCDQRAKIVNGNFCKLLKSLWEERLCVLLLI